MDAEMTELADARELKTAQFGVKSFLRPGILSGGSPPRFSDAVVRVLKVGRGGNRND